MLITCRKMCAVIGLALLLAGPLWAAQTSRTLQNSLITANFDNRGLRSVSARAYPGSFAISNDQFSLTIDSRVIQSAELANPAVETRPGSITYLFHAAPYEIRVVYQLKPGWRFVSKQLFISTDGSPAAFHVDQVRVISGSLGQRAKDVYVAKSHAWRKGKDTDYGIFFRYSQNGLYALVQNPFLKITHDDQSFSIDYAPDMDWKSKYGPFPSDRACIGLYKLTGEMVPAWQIPEWNLTGSGVPAHRATLDQGEINAFMNCIRAFVMEHRETSPKINVGWTENDYQINTATLAGRQEYERIIDRAAQMGLKSIVYAASNPDLALPKNDTDSWQWEHTLWLGLGQTIRTGAWNVDTSPLPASVLDLLDYAKSKHVKLIAYVYPDLPFQANPNWLVGNGKYAANLGNRDLQDWLIHALVTFQRRTGIAGYSFDYTWFLEPQYSEYSQWWGWKRVLETLRERVPHIIIDGRQGYQSYGPWTWLAGSYPHPTSMDEQPESFKPFPDLHTDRVSADRERFTAYRYRVSEFCPPELMPGFIGHQTERYDASGKLVTTAFHRRDWDYLGWRYSLISSIAVAGLNNVMSMIPARDPAEDKAFSQKDIDFFRDWMNWTDQNRRYLLNTRFILGQPAIGKVDGTTAIVGDEGYIFLFNPNGRALNATFNLDQSIGLRGKGGFLLKEIYPRTGMTIGKMDAGIWDYGDTVSLPLDGASAEVLKVVPTSARTTQPIVFNSTGTASVRGNHLLLQGVSGEVGTRIQIIVKLGQRTAIDSVNVNGTPVRFKQSGNVISVPVVFQGKKFSHLQQIGSYQPDFHGGDFSANFSIPERIFRQLKQRQVKWPIPWTEADKRATWLDPARLLLFVEIAEPDPASAVPELTLDGRPVTLIKAYNSIRANPGSFVGYYADVSSLQPDHNYEMHLVLPKLSPGQFQGVFFENVTNEFTSMIKEE